MLDCFFKKIPSTTDYCVLTKKLTIMFALASLALGSCTDEAPLYSSDLYDLTSPSLKYSVLSDEESDPYQSISPIITDSLKKALARFPNTKSCLIEEEHSEDRVDLRLIDWRQFKHKDELNVCLWRIFKSLNSTEAVEKWLTFQGFRISKSDITRKKQSYDTDTYERQTSVTPMHQITGSYSVNKTTAQLHPYKPPNAMLKIVHGHGISTLWIPNTNTLLHVRFNSTIE